MSDLEAAMAALSDYESGNVSKEAEEVEHDEVELVESEEVHADESTTDAEEAGDPPGLLSYEQWVAEGRDPEKYKGKKAYEAEYKRIQSEKELKLQVKALETTVKAIADKASEREAKIEARHRAELEKALSEAKEIGDVEAALEAKEQLHELNSNRTRQESLMHPVISGFINDNAVLANDDVKKEFERVYNGKLKADGVGVNDQLSEAAIKGYLRSAMDSVKSIYPDKFQSPRINRVAPVKTKSVPPSQAVDLEARLRAYKVPGAQKHNENFALEMYQSLKEISKEQADAYANSVLRGVK